jgi:GNAT superfamily N-acetyltransferase
MSQIEVSIATEATEEVVDAFSRLIPQLSTTASAPYRQTLSEIITAPSNTVLLARDRANGARIVGALTLVMFRIPTALRAWIEDVVVDSSVRGRGVGEALTEDAHRLYEKVGFAARDASVYRYASSHRKKAG